MTFQLRGVQQDDHASGSAPWGCLDSVPNTSLWSVHRSQPQLQDTAGGSAQRSVEEHQECAPLRKVSQTSSHVEPRPNGQASLHANERGFAYGHPGRHKSHPKHRRGRYLTSPFYVMDLFSGNGGVAHACRRLGFHAKEWDIRWGPQHDLTSSQVVRRIIREIRKGRVGAVMMAPVCTSFSVARDRTKVIRNKDHPWGLPPHLLTPAEQQKIEDGNRCFLTCVKVAQACIANRVPFILENPWSSKAWRLPPVQKLLQQPGAHLIRADFCQYGTAWKKPTGFLTVGIDMDDLNRLGRTCAGPVCSRTHRRHVHLTGSHPSGLPMTLVAQPYPPKLCQALAHALTAPWHYNLFHY